jgi:peptide deformylase
MILPILAYGNSLLRQKCAPITEHDAGLEKLISNMWETMENAKGCGLAAPQVGHAIRLFIVDSKTTPDDLEEEDRKRAYDAGDNGIQETFINAQMIDRSGDLHEEEEGCLSIPAGSAKIKRSWTIRIGYQNAKFEKQIRVFHGSTARMIQHEYDHIEGILYLDHLSPLTRKLMESKLKRIAKGRIACKYPMKFV